MRDKVSGARRWVVKIGSALLTADGRGLDQGAMAVWVEQMVALHAAGIELVLVSSGAVAAGMSRLGWQERPSAIHELQAAAAVGQMGLVQAWESSFARHGKHTAQILLVFWIFLLPKFNGDRRDAPCRQPIGHVTSDRIG